MLEQLQPWMHIAGRILFSMVFIVGGMRHLMKLDESSAKAASKGVPAAKAATVLAGVMLLAGGVMVLLGWRPFIGAGLLVIVLIPKAFLMHAYWKESDPQASANEMSHFMKTLALAGAALLIAVYAATGWPMSL